jgi:L-ascorbate metabolism protein UlaG (beta-lactamase superfamily)
MVPIGDRFTMSPKTAALAVKRFLKLDAVIPCHYGSFPIIEKDRRRFRRRDAGQRHQGDRAGEGKAGDGLGIGPRRRI